MTDAAYVEDIDAEDMEMEPEAEQPAAGPIDTSAINLAVDLDDTLLARMGEKVVEEYEIDETSRVANGWQARHDQALKLAMQVKESKNYPWPNAANVKYPLITVAAIQFAARAYPAIVDGSNVAKGKVMGQPTEEKRARAERVGRHMSYQLLDEMEEWEEGVDELLHILPCTGTVHKKTYFDPMKGRNCSEIVTSDKCVVNYWAKADPLRITQVCEFYPHEITAKIRAGLWLDQELGMAENADNDDDAPHTFLEQHRFWDLDDDGYPEPYIVTVHKETRKVVRIYARYDERGIKKNAKGEIYSIRPVKYFTRYRFMPSLDGSYYGMGFGTLLDALNETINSTINQLLDAGHLANTQGGFIGAGVSLKSGNTRFSPGEWKKVETSGAVLKDNIVPLPVGEPSNVLFQLLGMLIEVSKDITATKDILTGETGQANQPVGTTLAQIEQGLKVFSAIYKRIHRSLKQELGNLYRLNAIYLQPEAYFTFQDEEGVVAQADYNTDDIDVIPVSDPTVVTDMQRIGRAQFLMQFRGDPLLDQKEINRRVLEAASIDDVPGLFVKEAPPNPELQIEEKKLQQKDRELDQNDRKLAYEELKAFADAGKSEATAQETMLNTMMASPDFQAWAAQFIDQRVAEKIMMAQGAPDGGQPPAVQPGDVPGMEGPPADPAAPPVPPGPTGDVGPEMDGGGAAIPPGPNEGPVDGGVGEPGMA